MMTIRNSFIHLVQLYFLLLLMSCTNVISNNNGDNIMGDDDNNTDLHPANADFIDEFTGEHAYQNIQNVTFNTSNGGTVTSNSSEYELITDPSALALMHFNGEANDYSFDPIHGTIEGQADCQIASFRPGYGTACFFDGGTDTPDYGSPDTEYADYVEIPDGRKLYRTVSTQEVSISFWARSSGPTYMSSLNMRPFFQMANYCANADQYNCLNLFYGQAWQDAVAIAVNGGGFSNFTSNTGLLYSPTEGEWHHYTFTFSGYDKFAIAYIDGVYAADILLRTSNGLAFETENFFSWIGRASGYNFNGAMDEFVVYDRVLSDQEVAALFSDNRYQGGFESEEIHANTDIYGISMILDGNAAIYISTDGDSWCRIIDDIDFSDSCGLPATSFRYRAIFLSTNETHINSISFTLDTKTPICPDSDNDGFDDCHRGYYGDDGLEIDCRIENRNIYPDNDNPYCDCDFDNNPTISEICDDNLDNDCDGYADCDDPLCSDKSGCGTIQCYIAEVCLNNRDDNCDGITDEEDCQPINDYLLDWTHAGSDVDWVVFGDYPLYEDTMQEHNILLEASSFEEYQVRMTGPDAHLQWDHPVPQNGYYIIMISDIDRDTILTASIINNGTTITLPDMRREAGTRILSHTVGPGSLPIFYFLELEQGSVTVNLDYAPSHYGIYIRSSALFTLDHKKINLSATHPHLYFTEAEINDVINQKNNATLPAKYIDLFDAYYNDAEDYIYTSETSYSESWNQGAVHALSYSGVFNQYTPHLEKAISLLAAKLNQMNTIAGNVEGNILSYPYILKELSVGYDLTFNHMTYEQKEAITKSLLIEMKRQTLANISGQWWRYPRAGGWTSSHTQGFISALALDKHHPMSDLGATIGVLLAQTTLRDNVSIDGSYLQALSGYYGWDYHRTLVPFIDALSHNEKFNAINLYEYNNQALRRYDYYLIHSLHPNKKCFGPFGTSWCDSNLLYPSIGSSLLAAANYYNDGHIKWLYDNTYGEHTNSYLMFGDNPLMEVILWDDNTVAVSPDTSPEDFPLGKVMREHDHVFMRTGWNNDDISFISRCGLAGNHNQREHGDFTIDADGIMYVAKYSDYQSEDPFEENRYKNIVTIDGLGQSITGSMDGRFGMIPNFIHTETIDYALLDNSYAYNFIDDTAAMRVDYSDRHVIFLRPQADGADGCFVMFDSIKAEGTSLHSYTYQLRAGYNMPNGTYCGTCLDIDVSINHLNNGLFELVPNGMTTQRMMVEFIEPQAYNHNIWSIQDSTNTYGDALDLSHSSTTATGEFITLFFPETDTPSRLKPTTTRLSLGANQSGFTLADDTILWSQDGSALSYGSISSNAELVVVRDSTSPFAFAAMFNGTTFTYNGITYVQTSVITNAVITPTSDGLLITTGNESLLASDTMTLSCGGLQASVSYSVYRNGEFMTTVSTDANGDVTTALTIETIKQVLQFIQI